MATLKSDEVEKKYYTAREACKIINKEYQLSGKDLILPSTLTYWRLEKYISYFARQGSAQITKEELDNVKGFVYLHVVLGITLKKVVAVQKYLKTVISDSTTLRNINLYANKK